MLLLDALLYVFLTQTVLFFLTGSLDEMERAVFIVAIFIQTGLFIAAKFLMSVSIRYVAPKEKALIIGYNPLKLFYFNFLKEIRKTALAFDIVGIVCRQDEEASLSDLPFPILGQYEDIEKVIQTNGITTLILTSTYAEHESLQEFLITAHHSHSRLVTLDNIYEDVMRKVPYQMVSKTELLNLCLMTKTFAQLKKKRVIDLIISLPLLLTLFPVGCVVAALIKMTSKGSVFYIQERVGVRGKIFKMIKFRTMRMDAEKETGAVFTAKNDSRVNPLGKFLRKTHLDEIPQLLNVIKGDMSLVGPRPEREEFIKKIEKEIPLYALRLFTKPGITGWAQIHHGYVSSVEGLKEKFCYDLYYLKYMTLSFDLKILLLTAKDLFLATGQ